MPPLSRREWRAIVFAMWQKMHPHSDIRYLSDIAKEARVHWEDALTASVEALAEAGWTLHYTGRPVEEEEL
jgi:hypothetical protein